MNREIFFELINAKDFKKTLKYMRRYQAYMRNGIKYDQIYQLMQYDYKVFLEKRIQKKLIEKSSENKVSQLNELKNISTNITSTDDAKCKFKALSLARKNLGAK